MAIEHTVKTFVELHKVFRRYENDYRWMFRGHRVASWRLVPKAGRSQFFLRNEENFFKSWKRRAVEYIPTQPPNDWEWLAIAQHHGLSTRLLDWTLNPLIACFFAVAGNVPKEGAAVFAFRPDRGFDPEGKVGIGANAIPSSPFHTSDTIAAYRPSAFAARISRQGARFTLHSPPDADLTDFETHGRIEKLLIDASYAPTLQVELDQYGYNYATIFPDLDGLSKHLNWIASESELRKKLVGENLENE